MTTLPITNTAPTITHPFTPFVDDTGFPFGNIAGTNTNYAIAQNFKVPYSIQYSVGFQRELPGNFLLDMSYVGRQGRQLFSQSDASQILNFNWIYELPFGRGRQYGKNANGLVNSVIGGWEVTGIFTARSGLPFNLTTNSLPVGFVFNSPAVLNGSASALQSAINTTANGQVQFFSNTTQVFDPNNPLAGAVRNPVGGQIGNRNVLRGPGFWNVDMLVLKNFSLPWSESQRLQLRWELYNAFNHNSFNLPSTNINSTSFGQITSSASIPREMQFAIRFEF